MEDTVVRGERVAATPCIIRSNEKIWPLTPDDIRRGLVRRESLQQIASNNSPQGTGQNASFKLMFFLKKKVLLFRTCS